MSDLSKSENEIYSLRKEKEQKIKDSKLESFQTSFKNSTPIDFLHREHKDIENGFKTDINVSVRGRILSIRSFGKLTFIDLKDENGKIQLVYSDNDLSDELIDYLQNLDVGDIVDDVSYAATLGRISIKSLTDSPYPRSTGINSFESDG